MNNLLHPGILVLAIITTGCLNQAETYSAQADSEKTGNDMSQVIELNGSTVAEITKDGEIWIGGNKAGEITPEGEILVGGTREGELTGEGEVWKGGEKVGDITSDGAVWKEGNEIGTVETDGTIWVGSSRDGSFSGGDRKHAAVIVFYGFFELED